MLVVQGCWNCLPRHLHHTELEIMDGDAQQVHSLFNLQDYMRYLMYLRLLKSTEPRKQFLSLENTYKLATNYII